MVAQFSENFDSDLSLPIGWSVINGGDDNTWAINTPGIGTAHSGTNVARIDFDLSIAHDDYLITPQFTITAGVSNHLNLWAKSRSTLYQETFDILLSTTGTNASDFTEEIASAVAPGSAWQEFSYALSAYEGQTVYVAFKSTTLDEWELYLDDVVVGTAITAVPGCATNISPLDGATNVIPGIIPFAWSSGLGEVASSYDVYYGLTAGNANILIGNYATTSADITVAGFSTTFYWKVIAKNSVGEAVGCSEWSFTTQAPPGYCLNGNLYPAETFVPISCNGLDVNIIAEDCYAGEYSDVAVIFGQTYTFNSGDVDFITISNEVGDAALVYGPTPVTWISDRDGVVRFYSHVGNQCGTEDLNRVRSVICGIATCTPPTVTFSKVSNCPVESFFATADISDLGSANSITVTDDQGSISQTVSTAGLVSFGPYANGTLVILTVANDQDASCTVVGNEVTQATCVFPTNDAIVNAEAISCGTFYTGDTTNATLDQGDDTLYFGVDLDAPNVWYSYTGSGSQESVTLDLCGSSYDTSVLVFTGTPGNLNAIAGNDDDYTCGLGYGLNSRTSFISDGTTTYYIAVEGYSSFDFGAYNLNVTCTGVIPPTVVNQTCASALEVNVDGSDTSSDNSYGDVSTTQPICDPFGSIQDVWFSFIAPSSGLVDLLIGGGTMTSINYSIYSGACDGLSSLGCFSNQSTNSHSLTGLNSGEVYYVQVWSSSAGQGTFNIRLSDAGLAATNFELGDFNAYPNPVTNLLNLSFNKAISTIAVYNLLGQKVFGNSTNSKWSQIDMSHLCKGTYMVKVTAEDQVKIIKVVKE